MFALLTRVAETFDHPAKPLSGDDVVGCREPAAGRTLKDRVTSSGLLRRLMLGALVIFTASAATPETVHAQAACPAATGADGNATTVRRVSVGLAGMGSCVSLSTGASGYDDPASRFVDFQLLLPGDEPRTGATNPVKINVENEVDVDLNVTNLSCPGGTIGGVDTTVGTVTLDDGESCQLTVFWANGFRNISFAGGTLSRTGDIYAIDANGVVTGGFFGGTVETTPPALTAFTRQTPATATTGADTLVFRATFSEDVRNIDTADFAVNGTTTATVTDVTQISALTYDITVSGGDLATFNGTVGIDLAGGQNIVDIVGNALPAGEPATDEVYTVENDVIAPTVTITAPANTLGPYTATFTFSEDVIGFVLADIAVGNGTASNLSGGPAIYTATITPTPSGAVTTTVTIDVPAGAAEDGAGNNSVAAAQVSTIFLDENYVRTRTSRAVSNFMARRADQITANTPDLAERMQKRGGVPTGGPVGFIAEGDLENNKLSFSTSLRRIAGFSEVRQAAQREGLQNLQAFGQLNLASGADAGLEENGLDIWVQGEVSQIDNQTSDTDLGQLYVGLDYRVSPLFLVGLLVQFDWTDETDSTENIAIDGSGWLAGPYIVIRLRDNLLFDGYAAWGRSDNDASVAGGTGNFDTDRWLFRGTLTGDFNLGRWHFAPNAGVIYFTEEQEAFTHSLNIPIPGQRVSLGRVTFGPKVSTSFASADGNLITPHIGIKGIWDFEKTDIVDLTTGLAEGSDGFRGRVDGGVSMSLANGWSVVGEGHYDGIGANDFEAYGGSVRVNVPLN